MTSPVDTKDNHPTHEQTSVNNFSQKLYNEANNDALPLQQMRRAESTKQIGQSQSQDLEQVIIKNSFQVLENRNPLGQKKDNKFQETRTRSLAIVLSNFQFKFPNIGNLGKAILDEGSAPSSAHLRKSETTANLLRQSEQNFYRTPANYISNKQQPFNSQIQGLNQYGMRKRIMSGKKPQYSHNQLHKVGAEYTNKDDFNLQRNLILLNKQQSSQQYLQKINAFQSETQQFLVRKKSNKRNYQFIEREQLHEECLHLKAQLNEIQEGNLVLKNQKQFLQNELAKRDKIIENLNQNIVLPNTPLKNSQITFSPNLVLNLKRQIQDLQLQVEQKEEEVDFIKKKMKFTKINELQTELQITTEHLHKMRQFVQQTLLSSQDKQNQNSPNQSEKKPRLFSANPTSRPRYDSNLVQGSDTNMVMQLKDEIQTLKQIIDNQQKLLSSKKSSQDYLKKYNSSELEEYKKKALEPVTQTNGVVAKRISNTRSQDQELDLALKNENLNLKKKVENHNHQIEDLETQLREMKSKFDKQLDVNDELKEQQKAMQKVLNSSSNLTLKSAENQANNQQIKSAMKSDSRSKSVAFNEQVEQNIIVEKTHESHQEPQKDHKAKPKEEKKEQNKRTEHKDGTKIQDDSYSTDPIQTDSEDETGKPHGSQSRSQSRKDEEDDEFIENKNMKNAQEGILKIAYFLNQKNFSLRDLFKEYIYDEIIEGREFELMAIRIFSEVARSECDLEEIHIQAISILMSDHFIGESFDFNFFEEIFRQMGIIKREAQIDNKSLRVVLRLKVYLDNNLISVGEIDKIMHDDIYQKTIRVQGNDMVLDFIEASRFFLILQDLKVTKSSAHIESLQEFLQLHPTMKNDLVVNKLKKILNEIETIALAKHLGFSKRIRVVQEDTGDLSKKAIFKKQTRLQRRKSNDFNQQNKKPNVEILAGAKGATNFRKMNTMKINVKQKTIKEDDGEDEDTPKQVNSKGGIQNRHKSSKLEDLKSMGPAAQRL